MGSTERSLVSGAFDVRFDPKNGSIKSLRNPSDVYGTNFVLDRHRAPGFDIEDSRFLGDLIFHVRRGSNTEGSTMTSGLSGDIRSVSASNDRVVVSYRGSARNEGGFHGFSVTEGFSITDSPRGVLDWSIEVTNDTAVHLEFEDIGLPLLMNSYWGNDQTQNYEQAVHRHSFVAKHGSYLYWQRPNGDGPMLVLIPHRNTSLEFKQRFRENENLFGENLPKWEGLAEFYIHSKYVSRARSDKARQYLSATSLILGPGQTQKYGFSFTWASDYASLRNAIYASGGLDVISMPGMVIPKDVLVTLAVRSLDRITSVIDETGKGIEISNVSSSNGYRLFRLSFTALGIHHVKVLFGGYRSSILQYYCIDPIETLIRTHSAFLANHQLERNNRGYNGAFLQWDMTTQRRITWDDYPGGGWKTWMAGGSDDLGLAPAAYLSEKCFSFPVQPEISAIDYHIEHFLLGYLITAKGPDGQRSFQVYRWYDGQDGTPEDTGIWRAYNYTHIANTFFNMYRIAKAYPQFQTRYKAIEYLYYAYEILNAMYSKIPVANPIGDAANTLGLMGESTVPEIMEALGSEKMKSQERTLLRYVENKIRYYKSVKYPFASEMTIDTTGFESVYALSKLSRETELIEKSQKASVASRGLQPLWYFYGSDNRMMGESYWNLGYEAQLGALQQQDYLITYSNPDRPDFAEMMRSTYGAYLAGWANINSGQIDSHPANIGAASWLWQSEGGQPTWPWIPLIDSWWAWSGEADLGFWGALRTASVNVVQDPVVGLYAYGGEVQFKRDRFLIKPSDGVQRRLTLFNVNNLTVRVAKARFTQAIVAEDGSTVELDLQNVIGGTHQPTITLINAPAGQYELLISGAVVRKAIPITRGSELKLDLPELSSESNNIVIQRYQS